MIFQVWLGTTKAYDSGVVNGATTKAVSVPLGSATQLRLYVDPNGRDNYDHADWANAQLTCH